MDLAPQDVALAVWAQKAHAFLLADKDRALLIRQRHRTGVVEACLAALAKGPLVLQQPQCVAPCHSRAPPLRGHASAREELAQAEPGLNDADDVIR